MQAPANKSPGNRPSPDNGKIPAMKPVDSPVQPLDLIGLEDLQRRHEEERQAAAEIQYKMEQTA